MILSTMKSPMMIDSAKINMHQVGFTLFPDEVMLEVCLMMEKLLALI